MEARAEERGVATISGGSMIEGRRLRLCLVKQNTTYDLYTKTGPDLLSIASSSNWRSGPLGLWEAFDCEYRIVFESPDRECQIGKADWGKWVEGWDIWPEGSVAERAEDIDWGGYDIVVSLDMAIPTRIAREYPQTMWCYYFIENGTTSIDGVYRGSPYFGYNVFFNQRPARTLIGRDSPVALQMRRERRAVLDFPYHMMSAVTIRKLYGRDSNPARSGIMMTSHSREAISSSERSMLNSLSEIHDSGVGLTKVHRDGLSSKYCVVHPETRPITGVALVEAVSAGCVALAPRRLVIGVGYSELLWDSLDYSDFLGLLRAVERLENDEQLYLQVLKHQTDYVDTCFFDNPKSNLDSLFEVFQVSTASRERQAWSERRDRVEGDVLNLAASLRRRVLKVMPELGETGLRKAGTGD
jgi:hypothetical protein